MEFENYISHPGGIHEEDVLLMDHLRAVALLMKSDIPERKKTAADSKYKKLGEIIGLTHDVAKVTSWVQRHLRGENVNNSRYRYHSLPGAFVTQYCVGLHDMGQRDAVLASSVVAHHHNRSCPPDPNKSKNKYANDECDVEHRYDVVVDQFEDIANSDRGRSVANEVMNRATPDNLTPCWEEFLDWFDVDDVRRSLAVELGQDNLSRKQYADTLQLWTSLKFADQMTASLDSEDVKELSERADESEVRISEYLQSRYDSNKKEENRITRQSLERYIETELPAGEGIERSLNKLRNEARQEAVSNVEALIDSECSVGQITLPTGFGKTYAGLATALKVSEREGGNVVYVLPYTSILDQTADNITEVFDVDPRGSEFTLHHHLSETFSDLGQEKEEADIGRSLGELHAESWRSQLTLTTTVQLFESLAAPTGRQATKLPSLQNSAIVIDEPQSIPERWWKIVNELIRISVEKYDSTVILMTATQPKLVEYVDTDIETESLVGKDGKYVDFLEENPRVEYVVDESVKEHTTSMGYREAAVRITDNESSDTLSICNTRASAQSLHQEIESVLVETSETPVRVGRVLNELVRESGELPTVDDLRSKLYDRIENTGNTILAYLSGDIRPDDRQLIIDSLYKETDGTETLLNSDIQVHLVSTSVVEAGVDFSFDRVYRDVAPIPSIVQAGGRCNRSFNGGTGTVLIWELDAPPEKELLPSQIIYGGFDDKPPLLHTTKSIISSESTITEDEMVGSVVESFYSVLNKRYDVGSDKLVRLVELCRMEELSQERMIQDIEEYSDIVICSTEEERYAGGMAGDEVVSESDLVSNVGSHISAKAPEGTESVTIGNSDYYLIDASSDLYDPVFGLTIPE